jgi:peroxiredoxin
MVLAGFPATVAGCGSSGAGAAAETSDTDRQGDFAVDVMQLIQANWPREATARCRAAIKRRPDAPMPRALMALATWVEPNRAARSCWEAVRRREHGTALEQQLVDALQDYFWVKDQPELVDERFREIPQPWRAGELARRLKEVAADAELQRNDRDRALTEALLDWATRNSGPQRPEPDVSVEELQASLRHYNAYLQRTGAMPFEVSGYQRVVQLLLAKQQDPEVHAGDGNLPAFDEDPQLARVPRHPQLSWRALARRMPAWTDVGPEQWQPQQATGFELPAGIGGTRAFTPGDGKPTLVVFFLGFGCAHCVAQLKDLDPKAAAFRDAGIEVLSIGTDSYQEVLAAQQASIENGVDPLHFDVLCDPERSVFQQWGVWDELEGEALHGTFLVDGQGRVLWRDISERPFEESEWLLAECRRLLAAWQ